MDNVQNASMVQFDMGSAVEVMVKKNNGSVREVAIRPLSKVIEYKQIQNAILDVYKRQTAIIPFICRQRQIG